MLGLGRGPSSLKEEKKRNELFKERRGKKGGRGFGKANRGRRGKESWFCKETVHGSLLHQAKKGVGPWIKVVGCTSKIPITCESYGKGRDRVKNARRILATRQRNFTPPIKKSGGKSTHSQEGWGGTLE